MPTAHLIHGYIGAGKTTFAKKLTEEVNGVRFNPDEWMVRLYGEDPPADQFAERLERVFALLDDQWVRVVRCGVDVVLEPSGLAANVQWGLAMLRRGGRWAATSLSLARRWFTRS